MLICHISATPAPRGTEGPFGAFGKSKAQLCWVLDYKENKYLFSLASRRDVRSRKKYPNWHFPSIHWKLLFIKRDNFLYKTKDNRQINTPSNRLNGHTANKTKVNLSVINGFIRCASKIILSSEIANKFLYNGSKTK